MTGTKHPMAKKATSKKRKRRSDEQLIADLQSRIREVKDRQKSKELLSSPPAKAAVQALTAIDRALEVAAEHSETALRHDLAEARKPLVAALEGRGFKAPKAKLPRGRRPKA
jgi:hypothetical protein